MKALLSIRPGGPEALELHDIRTPEPAHGEVRIRVHACGINYPDNLIIRDEYQFKPQRPFAPGCEVAGVIEGVGSGVEGWETGQRVIATMIHGGLAEYAVVPAHAVVRLPEHRGYVEAAALMLAYATAMHALVNRGRLTSGETLLVLGAAGGVGRAAIEIGKALGAVVVAGVSTLEKAEAAKAAGADGTVLYGRAPLSRDEQRLLTEALKSAVGAEGADVIYDPVGGDYAEPALRAIAWLGRYLVIGFTAGIPRIPLNLALLKSCDVRGVFWGAFFERDRAESNKIVEQLLQWWSIGKINPHVSHVWPLERGSEAITCLSSRSAVGKIVVTIP